MRYTKAQLEKIVLLQLENMDAMNELLSIIRKQNLLLDQANKTLQRKLENENMVRYVIRRKRRNAEKL